MTPIETIIETGSYTDKSDLARTIESLKCRKQSVRAMFLKSKVTALYTANEIMACDIWIESLRELKNNLPGMAFFPGSNT